jgi:caa(3)-type oxidase subunit IV
MSQTMTEDEKRKIWAAMRVPVFAFAALLVFLVVIVGLGWFVPGRTTSFIEAGLTLCMVLTVLLFSMEVREEASLLKFYSFLGFCWLSILMFMTMVDYITR